MLASKQLHSAKSVGQAHHASIAFKPAVSNCRSVGGQPCSRLNKIQFTPCDSTPLGAVSCRRARLSAAANAETATAVTAVETGLKELNKDTFYDFINSAGDAVVVVDFFTDWCGPCKLIYPQLVQMSAELSPAAQIVKFNCNQANKELAKTLGIKVAPTFHLYKGGVKVADMTGAKVDKLRSLIDEHMTNN